MKKRKPAANAAKARKKKAASKPFLAAQARLAGDEITQSAAFRRATADAEDYAGDRKRLQKLVEDAVGKINTIPRGPFGETTQMPMDSWTPPLRSRCVSWEALRG